MLKEPPAGFISPQINKWSKRLLISFWLGFGLLAVGLVFVLLPIVTITIIPQVEELELPVVLQIDLKLPSVLEKAGVVPGYALTTLEEEKIWLAKGYEIFSVGDNRIAAARNHLLSSLKTVTERSLAPDLAVLPEEPEVAWGQLKEGFSNNVYNLPVKIKIKTYHKFPLTDWVKYISGLPFDKAQIWLKGQLWVKDISIQAHPNFLANIRQNIPLNGSLIRFRLDNNGKTSILQWRSR